LYLLGLADFFTSNELWPIEVQIRIRFFDVVHKLAHKSVTAMAS